MYNEQMIQELRKRWNALQQALAREGGDAILITTNVNLFYVSGRIFSGAAYVRLEGDPLFFVRRPVGLKGGNVIYIRKPEEIAGHLQQRGIPMPRSCSSKPIPFPTTSIGATKRSSILASFATERSCCAGCGASRPFTRSAGSCVRACYMPGFTSGFRRFTVPV